MTGTYGVTVAAATATANEDPGVIAPTAAIGRVPAAPGITEGMVNVTPGAPVPATVVTALPPSVAESVKEVFATIVII